MTPLGAALARVDVTRAIDRADRIVALRRDGSTTTWTCPTYGGTIPHDLVHLVVEAVFELDAGLWGCVARGLDMHGIRARSASDDGGELLTAEALSTVNFYDDALDGAQRCEAVIEACTAFPAAAPSCLDPARCERVTAILKPLKARCRSLSIGSGTSLDALRALTGVDVLMRVVPGEERDAW